MTVTSFSSSASAVGVNNELIHRTSICLFGDREGVEEK